MGHELVAVQKQVYSTMLILFSSGALLALYTCRWAVTLLTFAQCKPLLAKLDSYKELPADQTLARVQVERVRTYSNL
jgi:hypothetical protein